jgi:hypothetical protein
LSRGTGGSTRRSTVARCCIYAARLERPCSSSEEIMRHDLYEAVSARIVAELERGAAPWIKPWSATSGQNVPQNAVASRPYSGCNVVLLWMAQQAGFRTPRYLTYGQALELGGHVRKGEHGFKVYFVKQWGGRAPSPKKILCGRIPPNPSLRQQAWCPQRSMRMRWHVFSLEWAPK